MAFAGVLNVDAMEYPKGLSRSKLKEALAVARGEDTIAGKIDCLSRYFVGYPYTPFPLIGSAESPEVFTATLDGFDCVTFIETILALARAADPDAFVENLRMIRYAQGRIDWRRRNHYMTGWIRNNRREGIIEPIRAPGVPTVMRERVLNLLPGLPERTTKVEAIPKRAIRRLAEYLRTGDLIFFASTRPHLDTFHTGIIIRDDGNLLLRHASRSQGGVVEQPLNDFLQSNRMAGVIVVRPREMT